MKSIRRLGLLWLYSAGLLASLWLSYELRFDFSPAPEYWRHFWVIAAGLLGVKIVLLVISGQFGSLLSYFSLPDVFKLLSAVAGAALVALIAWAFGKLDYAPPRAVILTDFIISFVYLCGLRMVFRLMREGYFHPAIAGGAVRKRIAIIGAGDVGSSLAKELLSRRGSGMLPVAFFDDDPVKWGTSLHGIPVKGAPETISAHRPHLEFDEVVIAMPSVSGKRLREVLDRLNEAALKFEIVPSYEQLVTGRVRVSQIRPVEIDDLLGREPVSLATERIKELLRSKVVMVTGAGGSIGSELCRQIAAHNPERLLLVERCEVQMFQIEQELAGLGYGAEVVPLVADILDEDRLRGIFERFRPDLVFHAAAHKHVPMMEQQPLEAVRNNAIGTGRIASLALEFGTERFVLISTDKAINPTSVMGATKRMAELYVQALQPAKADATAFMAVRFGNVLGSSGSVVTTFKRQIAAGGPITVTHPDVTRYFMTVHEAVGLVLQSVTIGQGGDILVLDMGKPMKITALANQLIELSGLRPGTDIEIKFTGLRPGEKLFEEINHNTEDVIPTEHAKITRLRASPPSLSVIEPGFSGLLRGGKALSAQQVKIEIQKFVPEYKPYQPEI